MLPAEVVGGDYYDIIPVEDGCWLAIGDVAGPGLAAGAREVTEEPTSRLGPGALMLLCGDGVGEADGGRGARFGLQRVRALLVENRERSPQEVRNAIMGALLRWTARPDDDGTLLIIR